MRRAALSALLWLSACFNNGTGQETNRMPEVVTIPPPPQAPLPAPAPPPPDPPGPWAVRAVLQVQPKGDLLRASLILQPGPLRESGWFAADDRAVPHAPLGCERVAQLLPGSADTCAGFKQRADLWNPEQNNTRCRSPGPSALEPLIAWAAAEIAAIPLAGQVSLVTAPDLPAADAARIRAALAPLAPGLVARTGRISAGHCTSAGEEAPLPDLLTEILSTQGLHRDDRCAAPAAYRYRLDLTAAGETVTAEAACALCDPAPPPEGSATLRIDTDPALDQSIRFLRSTVRDDDLFGCFTAHIREVYHPEEGTQVDAEVRFRRQRE